MGYKLVPNVRELLFHETIAESARLNPKNPYMFTLDSDVPDAQIQTITYEHFLTDVARIAKGLQHAIPKRQFGTAAQNIGILAKSSYSYAVHWVACQFNGWIPILISTKNSREGTQHLLSVSGSTHLIADTNFNSYAQSLELAIPIVPFLEIPEFTGECESIELDKITEAEREVERKLPAFYLHTSGSTGHPKLIGQTQGIVAGWAETNAQIAYGHHALYPQGPLYHAFGSFTVVGWPTNCGCASLLHTTTKPYNGEMTLSILKQFKAYLEQVPLEQYGIKRGLLLVTVPLILGDIANGGIPAIQRLAGLTKGVVFGGARVSEELGDLLTENGVNLASGYGSTEMGSATSTTLSDKPRTNGEWRYSPFRDTFKLHWIPTDDPNRNQLVLVPDRDSVLVFNHEDPLGFDTKDTWIEHPTKKGWYRHGGRAGDVLVLNNGEKTDKKQLELFMLNHIPKIKHLIVFGSGRSQNGLLISPAEPVRSHQEFVKEIWPTIEEMNKVIPAHSRVVKELVLIEDALHPFSTTDKGTVREGTTLQDYEQQIEKAYIDAETGQQDIKLPTRFEQSDIMAYLQESVQNLLPETTLTADADLFEHGLDSLLAVRLRAFIVILLQKASPTSTLSIPRNIVYDHPSIAALANYVLSFIRSPVKSEASSEQDDIKTRLSRVVERYTEGLTARRILNGVANGDEESECVVVTGATGSLGAFLVDQLLDRPTVKKIYCFNRKLEMDTRQRQINAFRERGLEAKKLEAALEDRVFVYDVDLSQPRLGLSDVDYKEITTHLTHIIHVAWQLNFHLRMEGFEKVHIAGVRHLIDLALASSRERSPHFVFVSSIATIARQRSSGATATIEGPILEESSASLGYGLAKLAGERICETACKKAKLDTTIVRIGQISGSIGAGAWARTEYNPILFRSCFGLGAVPKDLPPVRWLPVDLTAQVVLKQTFVQHGETRPMYYHLENPTESPWSIIADAISNHKGANLAQIPIKEWVAKVRERGIADAEKVPAIRLLEFFENVQKSSGSMDITNTLKLAPEVDHGVVSPDLVHRYLDYQGI